jgi:hypothetical protein
MILFRLVPFASIQVIAGTLEVQIETSWTSMTCISIEKDESMLRLLTAAQVIVQRMKMRVLKIRGMEEAQFTI